MKKLLFIFSFLVSVSLVAQNRKPVTYSKLFDSYYRKGPLKFTFEPGVSIQSGVSYAVGLSVNYKFNAPIEGVLGLKTIGLSSGSLYQLNLQGRYYLRYDRIRTNYDRRQKPKIWNLYLLTGVGFAPITTMQLGIPIGIGIPFRLSERVAIVPEYTYMYSIVGSNYMLANLSIEFNPKGKKKKQNMRKRGRAVEDNYNSTDDSESSEPTETSSEPEIDQTTPVKEETIEPVPETEESPVPEENTEEEETEEETTEEDEFLEDEPEF